MPGVRRQTRSLASSKSGQGAYVANSFSADVKKKTTAITAARAMTASITKVTSSNQTTGAGSQRIVATRLLCRVQCPVAAKSCAKDRETCAMEGGRAVVDGRAGPPRVLSYA